MVMKVGDKVDLEQLALKLQETADRSVRNEGRIKKLETEHETLHELATSVALLAQRMEQMNGSVTMLANKVEEIEKKPAKRYEDIVDKIVWAVVGAAVAFILGGLGL